MSLPTISLNYNPLWRLSPAMILHAIVQVFASHEAPDCREQSFQCLTARYGRLIAGICLSFAESREDFEDLRQDVMLNIWKGLGGYRADSSASTWIYRVALNTCVSSQRKKRRRSELSLNDLYNELYDTSSAEDIAMYRLMYELIGRLKPVDKSVVLMWLDGKSYEEIASVTGLPVNAVAARLKRAKDRLSEFYNNSTD